jgi:hypothetical protein
MIKQKLLRTSFVLQSCLSVAKAFQTHHRALNKIDSKILETEAHSGFEMYSNQVHVHARRVAHALTHADGISGLVRSPESLLRISLSLIGTI